MTSTQVNALELKGAYVGQTAPKVKAAVADAIGGCLFIDEAYALAARGGDSFSGEAARRRGNTHIAHVDDDPR